MANSFDIVDILRGLAAAWEEMHVPKFKKRKWENLRKHIETSSSLKEWKQVLSNFMVPYDYHFTMNPLSESDGKKVIEEGIRLFHEGKASQVMFLSYFYKRVGGIVLPEYDLHDTLDEIRCRASFVAAIVATVLEVGETLLYCYETEAIITGSRFSLGHAFFNMKQNAMLFITDRRILFFGGFPELPPQKIIDKKLYALYRLFYPDAAEKRYLEGLDIIERSSIMETIADKSRGQIVFNADYFQLSSNIPGFNAYLPITAVLRELDKRRSNVKNGKMSYFITIKPDTEDELWRCLKRIEGTGNTHVGQE